MDVLHSAPPPGKHSHYVWLLPLALLGCVYGLLGLTLTRTLTHSEIMSRCVLVNPSLARIWSVGNIEIGLAYFGVFGGMVFYFLRAYQHSRQHIKDLGLAVAYVFGSFVLDFWCVQHFEPFPALLIGDAAVMTFTVLVSRQVWFKRLLGVFVPIIFFSCAVGHFLEGLSYWHLTYNVNTPWTMVTADVGFAVLVNASRFPAFIRGEDIVDELARTQTENSTRQAFVRDVLLSVTGGKLRLCNTTQDLPAPLPPVLETPLSLDTMSSVRREAAACARRLDFLPERVDALQTAVAEATMNAVVHGGGGEAVVRADTDTMQIWVTDHGTGIQMEQLPRAALEKGFSTKASLGHGFWLMLQMADQVSLLTGAGGTTVVVSLARQNAASFFPFSHPAG